MQISRAPSLPQAFLAIAPLALTDALQDRFRFERELGRGGMGLVLLAHDIRHHRLVAFKLMRPEVASIVGSERFLREIQLAAQLQHPNIVPVYESGECEDTLYYVMPYVEGESLRARLRRDGQLPLTDALQIAREVADALAYAHAHGVVHRDIKPENILLAGGHALVVDFGIARALTAAGTDRLTETGLVIGTPAYMSPEQSTGSEALDGRTDLYSLGCVVYEMLAGEPPYTGPSSQAIIAKRFTEPIPHLRTMREGISDAVEQAVTKALAKVPADRFASATEFARALQPDGARTLVMPRASTWGRRRFPLAAATLGLGLAIGLGVLFAWRRSHDVAVPTVKRLAVLPFENLGDSAEAYFADGMTDAVRGKLTALPELRVIATTSSNQYRRTTKPPRQIGQELGVDYLLVGKVRWIKAASSGSRVQVSPELVEVGSATARWQQPFDAALTDVFQVQADIAGQVAQALGVALSSTSRAALAARPTQNLAAYDALLRGDRRLVTEGRLDDEATREAVAAYREAVRLDSTFGLAWARLAWAEVYRYGGADVGEHADSIAQAARQAADRALALAPGLAETYHALGSVRGGIDKDRRGGISAFEHARTLAPHDVNVLSQLATVLAEVGRYDEAVAVAAEAARLDPRSPLVARRYAHVLAWSGRFAAAESVATAALQTAPDNPLLLKYAFASRLAQGRIAGARSLLHDALAHVPARRLVTLFPDFAWLMDDSLRALALRLPPQAFGEDRAGGLLTVASINWNEGRYAAARADADSARPLLEQRAARLRTDEGLHWSLAITYAYLGRCAEAVQEAERTRVAGRYERKGETWHILALERVLIGVRCGDYAGAVAWADTLIHSLGPITPAWLRVDPNYAPLRGRPDFERLVARK